MTQDEINKIQTIAGYLRPLYDDLDILKKMGPWSFMPALVEEVEEWVTDLLKNSPETTTEVSDAPETAPGKDRQ